MKTFLMSIRPPYSERIFAGTKKFELRKSRVNAAPGDVVVVYSSSPVQAVIGAFVVGSVVRDDPARLWARHSAVFGISRSDYEAYFAGRREGHAIEVGTSVRVTPRKIDELRLRFGAFHPPQSYMYWRGNLDELIGERAARKIRAAGASR